MRQHRVLTVLVRAQSDAWKRSDGQLSEFIRKKDYRFRDETRGDERDAWPRAIMALVSGWPD